MARLLEPDDIGRQGGVGKEITTGARQIDEAERIAKQVLDEEERKAAA